MKGVRAGALRFALLALLLVVAAVPPGCGAANAVQPSALDAARSAAQDSSDPEAVGRWLLYELLAAGGDAKRARLARLRLEELGGGQLDASLGRAVDADVHGRFPRAVEGYLKALAAMRDDERPDVPLRAWFAASRLVALSPAVAGLWPKARALAEQVMADPARLGWRARGEIVEWWSRERIRGGAEPVDHAVFDEIADRHGCLREVALAGPFGHAPRSDHRVHFEAEQPAPWPAEFRPNARRLERAEVRELSRHGCLLNPKSRVPGGIYYVQSFIDLPAERELIVAVQGALAIRVDDAEVLTRDTAVWGIWSRFGVRLRLAAGRHRILARIGNTDTSIRVLEVDGRPAGLVGSADDRLPYVLAAPIIQPDPNVLEPFLRELGVPPQPGTAELRSALDLADPVNRYVAAYLAQVEGQFDVASVILEPLAQKIDDATPAVLAQQAMFVDQDPIFSPEVGLDLSKDLRERAARLDPELWAARLWLVLQKGAKSDPSDRVAEMEQLGEAFPEVPPVTARLAALYGELGWTAEHARVIEQAAARFPEDLDVLKALLEVQERRGNRAAADALSTRIRKLAPAEEVEFRRAIERRDWTAAVSELERIGSVRPDREDIALRIEDLKVRAGLSAETLGQLQRASTKDPSDAAARLALADARYALGDRNALGNSLAEAIRTGADTRQLRAAIELTEGMTDLAPYRRDGLRIIREAEASGVKMPGTAARLLDYVTLWVEPDGSARMLEHEIIRVQSREGIEQHVEQQVPRGIVLRMRTIKKDGTVYEPESIAAKPTVTMPHLEVGDYIETESIWLLPGDGQGGRAFLSPRWMFREQNVSYHLSEFVVVSPRNRPLAIETTGRVPAPEVENNGALVVRRWRVTDSTALPEEPLAAPSEEYLPSVRVGWGIDLEERLRRLIDAHRDELPRDPRLVRLARTIIAGKLAAAGEAGAASIPSSLGVDERARRIYRWVLDNVQPGNESIPPRIVTGKSGDRTLAFAYLCRMAGIDARLGVVEDRLSPPPTGPFSEATRHTAPAVRLQTEHGPRWLAVSERFAPYGFLPSSLRGQPAVLLDPGRPIVTDEPPPILTEKTSVEGSEDRILHSGEVKVREDGSAEMRLVQHYHGKYAILVRTRLAAEPEPRWRDVLEAEVLGVTLPGGRITSLEVKQLNDLDEPVVLSMRVELASFARPSEGGLEIEAPFLPRLAPLGELAERQTPLYLSERVANRSTVDLAVELPRGAQVQSELAHGSFRDEEREVEVKDHMDGDKLRIDRRVDVPAGRVQPEHYAAFRAFVLGAEPALHRTIRIALH